MRFSARDGHGEEAPRADAHEHLVALVCECVCPAGSTTWNDKNCGRGNFCPWGSSAPTSCGPRGAIDPVLGPANGPAFANEVAACSNHCYFGAPGQLSA